MEQAGPQGHHAGDADLEPAPALPRRRERQEAETAAAGRTAAASAAAEAEAEPEGGASLASPISLRDIGRKAARDAEREALKRVLYQTNWNRKKAARILEVSYKTLLQKIKECGLGE